MGDRGTAVPDNPPGLVLLALPQGGVEDQQQHLTTGDQSVSQRRERREGEGGEALPGQTHPGCHCRAGPADCPPD